MQQVKTIILVLLVLLGAAAGLAKITLAPPEVEFFKGLGLGTAVVLAFGILQLAGALLLVLQKTRLIGAVILDITFTLSVVMIFMTSQIGFALVSVIPVIMAGYIIYDTRISSSQRQL
jgi:hypothetical protein